MADQARKLRDLIAKGDHFVAAEAYSAVTGRIVDKVGFKAAYLGGHACSLFHYAMPDYGVFSQVEQIEQAGRIAEAMDIPLIADADTLGETVADAYHFTRRYVRAGIAGYHVEDEVNPKHSTWSNGLLPIADFQAKLEACTKARGDSALVIIARCDELYPDAKRGGGSGSLDEAIKRGKAYAEAGADLLTYPFATNEQIAAIADEVPIPMSVIGFPAPRSVLTMSTGWGAMGAAIMHLKRARELFETGQISDFEFVLDGKEELLEQDLYDALISDWVAKTGRKGRQ
jgi:2-methylisocitrate lyase-like PEP mutase family enzyme